jgi:DinB family protein
MRFRVGIENNNEGIRTAAWALQHPGCYAYGENGEKAMAALPGAIRTYSQWIGQHEPSWLKVENIELEVEGVWDSYYVDEDLDRVAVANGHYLVDSWFQHDWKPLTAEEIERGLKLLAWSRADLIKLVQRLPAEKLDQTYPGEKWNINGILKHMAGSEWWYMERLGKAFPKRQIPKTPMEQLEKVRAAFLKLLPKLEGVSMVVGLEGELWSPRKVLRRAVWHERDHTVHIRKLI